MGVRRLLRPVHGALTKSATGGAVRALYSLRGPLEDEDAPHELGTRFRSTPASWRGRPPLADVYLPDGPGPHPSMIWVHGGGFTVGSRRMKPMRFLATACRREGYAVLTFDYRLLFRGGHLQAAVDDVRAATDWWFEQAERLNLDVERVAMGGLSAGGCLSLLAAHDTMARIQAYVSVFALYDIGALDRGLSRTLGRLVAGRGSDKRTARSPAGQAPIERPMLLMHGSEDTVVPAAQVRAYAEAREALHHPTQLRIFEGAHHGFFSDPGHHAAVEGVRILKQFLRETL
jgi:acetyl esterase/lipase